MSCKGDGAQSLHVSSATERSLDSGRNDCQSASYEAGQWDRDGGPQPQRPRRRPRQTHSGRQSVPRSSHRPANPVSLKADVECWMNRPARANLRDFDSIDLRQERTDLTQLHRRGYAARHTDITASRSQRCAGSSSTRGCHVADILISGVRTGSLKLCRPTLAA
jgi:hypothetical protein